MKPGYKCITSIRAYFASLPSPIQDHELIVVGDRVFTDVVMANRMQSRLNGSEKAEMTSRGPLTIWTTGIWQSESMLMRRLELGLVNLVKRWSEPSVRAGNVDNETRFTRFDVEEEVKPKKKRWGVFR